MIGFLAANTIPLAPPLHTRLLALLVIEAALLLLVALLYLKWVQLRDQSLDEWWERRKKQGLSRQSLFEMEESERKRLAAQSGGASADQKEKGAGGQDAGTGT
jgi:hypothetical protein